jgi:hypothetical protein
MVFLSSFARTVRCASRRVALTSDNSRIGESGVPGPNPKIRALADVAADAGSEAARVEVRICCDQTNPPVGQLSRVIEPAAQGGTAAEPIHFSGWLGLLRALSDALDNADDEPRKSENA